MLRVVLPSGGTVIKRLVIHVAAPNSILIAFWSERYTMESGQCTTLHWSVEGVERVFLRGPSGEAGVPGVGERGQVCPNGQATYTLRVEASGGRTASRDVYVRGGQPEMVAGEVVAQAIVRDVAWTADLDGNPANGEVSGWNIFLDGINALYTGGGGCCEIAGSFQISQTLWADVEQQLGVFDWPLSPRQLVEFRARGTSNLFIFDLTRPIYFKRRA